MRRLAKRSRAQLALSLEREVQFELSPDQESALLLALADLLLEALGETPPVSTDPGESHER
jgi:hypothetical protein